MKRNKSILFMLTKFIAFFIMPFVTHSAFSQVADESYAVLQAKATDALKKNCKDLSMKEACEIIAYLNNSDVIKLRTDWCRFQNDDGIKVPAFDSKIALEPTIAGVIWELHSGENWHFKSPLSNLDPRTVVALYKLSNELNNNLEIVGVIHNGIGQGRGASNDCHNTGRAIDIEGVMYRTNANPEEENYEMITVTNDWTMRKNFVGENQYRLVQGDDSPIYEIFKYIVDFGNRETTYVISPDNGIEAERKQHQDHIHMQIGPTFSN